MAMFMRVKYTATAVHAYAAESAALTQPYHAHNYTVCYGAVSHGNPPQCSKSAARIELQ